MTATTAQEIGTLGYVREYAVVVLGDTAVVLRGDVEVTREVVNGLGRFMAEADDLRVGWAELPDFEVVYLYDRADSGFGYAINLSDPWLSEWGYAPFAA